MDTASLTLQEILCVSPITSINTVPEDDETDEIQDKNPNSDID